MKLKYRPEIDGLRAIAVGAVILYHAQIPILGHQLFKGGFIGVDIFFVISGYLITSIILKELITTGTFSFKHFYERRVRRILPVLLFVMLLSLPFAWMGMLPNNFIDFSKSILYSLGFSSNYYFDYTGQVYGDRGGLYKPFLHTWSLSVEEQFYILFPIILLITFKYFREYLIYILTFGFIISLGLAEWTSRNDLSASFYFLHTRIWELLAGSILAYFEIIKGYRNKYKPLNLILPTVGLILIGHSVLFFNTEILHPSFYTLSPIIGICLIIWFSNKDEPVTRILSTKLFVGIGLISYSLYLWHYPIFAFARIGEVAQFNIIKLLILISLLVLSLVSYFFIEKPARNNKFRFISVLKYICIAIFLTILFSIIIIGKQGKLNKLNIKIEKSIGSPLFESECKYSSNNINFLRDVFFKKRFYNCKKKFGKFILILGDSHSIDLFNSISKISNEKTFIVGLNRGACRPNSKFDSNCHYSNALKFIKKHKENIKFIFFNHKGSYFLTNKGKNKDFGNSKFRKLPLENEQIKNTINYLLSIKKLKKELIFIGPHLEPNITLTRKKIIDILINKQNLKDNTNYDLLIVDKKLKEITSKHNIPYVSKIDILQYDFKKDFIVNNSITFSDTDHWNNYGEVYFGKKLVFNSIIKDILFP
jgi:peptidoglycan/LPS O-acetylase OafA/YrhL